MRNKPFNLDEREQNVYRSLITRLYFITLTVLIAMQLYRQFALDQPMEQWNDIALLITFNVLFLLGGGLYLSGALNLRKIKARYIVIGYAAFVLIGLLFTIFKYALLLGQDVGLEQIWNYFLIVAPISAVLLIFWGLLGYLGHRRVEKQIE
jgi:cation transport ATPase